MAVLLAFLMMPMVPAGSALADDKTADVTGITVVYDTSWSKAVYAEQTVKATVTVTGATSAAGDTVDVTLVDSSNKEVAKAEDVALTGDAFDVAEVTFAVPASQAAIADTYNVKVHNAEDSGFEVKSDEAANTNWSGHEAVMNVNPDADDEYYFAADGDPVDFTVEDVLDPNGEGIGEDSFVYAYYEDEGTTGEFEPGTDVALTEAPSKEDSYLVTVWPTAEYADGAYLGVTDPIVVPFTIGPAAAAGEATLFEADPKYPENASDTTFTYVGKDYLANKSNKLSNLGLAVDGKVVDFYIAAENTDGSTQLTEGYYYVKTVDGTAVAQNTINLNKLVKDAGTYAIGVAKYVSGNADAATNPVLFNLTLTVDPFDLSGATVTANDMTAGGTPTLNVVNGGDTLTADAAAALDVKISSYEAAKGVTAPAGVPSDFSLKGEYGLAVSPKVTDGVADKNFAGSATSTVGVYGSVDSGFTYGNETYNTFEKWNEGKGGASGDAYLVFDRSEGEAFDASQVSSTGKGGSNPAKYYDIVFRDASGDVVSSPDAAGAYTAEVSVKSDLSYDKGGSDTLSFRVVESADVNVYFTVDGKPMAGTTGNNVTFSGQAIPYSVAVKAAGKTLPASEYEVKVTVKSTGEEVSEVVDPGTYVISVESDKYAVSETCEFSVTEAVYAGFEVVQQSFGWDPEAYSEGSGSYVEGIPYTGSAVEVAVRAYNVVNGERAYTDLAPELYTLTFADKDGKKVAAEDLSKAVRYTATIKLTQAAEDANIKDITDKEAAFSIVDEIAGYKDVHAADWFADVVAKATGLGYVKGVGGTEALFVPNVSISRADAAIIIFRMAGGKENPSTDVTYPTQFTDVPGDSYFAQAVEWASKAGVVNGTSETTFDPYASVTRQELATMLYRAFGGGASADASALDAFVDADQVADWAETAMAWAVEEGYMNGKGADDLQPQGQATRAEVAALSVRVAPAEEIEE